MTMSSEKQSTSDTYSYTSVVEAVGVLYNNSNGNGHLSKESASQWLDGFQKSIYSWQICNDILQHNTDLSCCYFAAQTMRSKIKYQFHELPPNTHHDLKASLFSHLNSQSRTSPQVVTQLCLAIADLALQMVQWRNSLQEIIVTLSRDGHLMDNLLEILFVMPEEINNKSLRLGQNRRHELIGEWDQHRLELLDFFASCLNQYESAGNWKLANKLIGTFGQWWSVGVFADNDFVEQHRMDLLLAPFRFIAGSQTATAGSLSPDLAESAHTTAAECLCSAFYAVEAVDLYPTVVPAMVNAALGLEPAYQASVAAEDTSRLPYMERVVVALVKHCQCASPNSTTGDADQDTTGFHEFRERVTELLEDVLYLVEPERLLCTMFNLLKEFEASSSADWRLTEAVLFILCIIVSEVSSQENEVTPQLLHAVLSLPPDSTPIPLQLTGLTFLGKMAVWVNIHQEFLGAVFPVLLNALSNPELVSASASALGQYCTFCKTQMQSQFAGLLQVAETLPNNSGLKPDAAQELLCGITQVLSRLPDEQQITAGLQRLCDVQVAGLEAALAARTAAGSRSGCSGGSCCGPNAGKANPIPWLDCLATLFREFHPNLSSSSESHPGLPVMRAVWPSIERTLAQYPDCMRVVEHTCRVIRYQVRCLKRSCAPLLPQLADRIMLSYAACPHSCFLYLAGILTDEFGEDSTCQVGLLQLLEAMMGPTLATLESGRGLAQNPDMAEDLFRLCTRFLQRCPGQLLASRALPTIWQLALGSLSAEHRDAVASVTKFLQELLQLGQHNQQHREPVLALLSDSEQGGAALTRVLVHASVLQLSSYSVPDAAEVLHSLLLLDQRTVSDWIGAALLQLPATRPDGLVQATPDQIQHFHRTLANSSDVSDMSRQLQQLARLFK
uniref:Importin N-terminal domain-containing protein n=1 Tax=Macrostomum lignano TaxID=282301 RepID=A0A1I8JGN8_9PLAT